MDVDLSEVHELLAYIRRMALSFILVFLATIVVLAFYREPLHLIYDLAKRGLGTTVIAGQALSPLVSYMYVSLLYAVEAWVPIASALTYRYVKPALLDHEQKWLKLYAIAIPVVFTLSLVLAVHIFYPAFIRISLVFAELVGAEPVYTVDSITMLFVASLLLTAVTLVEPLALSTILHTSQAIRRRILESSIRDRALVYAGLYWLYAVLTPGDTVLATLLYIAILIAGTELVIAYWKHNGSKQQF